MNSKKKLIILILCIFAFLPIHTTSAQVGCSYQVCFTPGENCTQMIVNEIKSAKQSIYVQAYSFTSAPIASALLKAKKQGTDVQIILDKSQINHNRYSSARFFINMNMPIWIDYQPAIAHNKVMIIDKETVITGSFNFTKAAQQKNAENLIIIKNSDLAKKYLNNFLARKAKSISAEQYSLR